MSTSSSSRPLPRSVRAASTAWLVAVAAAVLEAAVSVAQALDRDPVEPAELVVQLAVRTAVLAAIVVGVAALRRGANIARWLLAILVGGLGLGSLMIGPVEWVAAGHSLGQLRFEGHRLVFAVSRAVHVVAVVVAVVLMFVPSAEAWFAEHRRDRSREVA